MFRVTECMFRDTEWPFRVTEWMFRDTEWRFIINIKQKFNKINLTFARFLRYLLLLLWRLYSKQKAN